MTVAKSNYRQLRLTLTEGLDGRWRGDLALKPYSASWQVKHHLLRLETDDPMNPQSAEDALLVLMAAIDPAGLPRS